MLLNSITLERYMHAIPRLFMKIPKWRYPEYALLTQISGNVKAIIVVNGLKLKTLIFDSFDKKHLFLLVPLYANSESPSRVTAQEWLCLIVLYNNAPTCLTQWSWKNASAFCKLNSQRRFSDANRPLSRLFITSFEIPFLFSKDAFGRQWKNGPSCVFEHVLAS